MMEDIHEEKDVNAVKQIAHNTIYADIILNSMIGNDINKIRQNIKEFFNGSIKHYILDKIDETYLLDLITKVPNKIRENIINYINLLPESIVNSIDAIKLYVDSKKFIIYLDKYYDLYEFYVSIEINAGDEKQKPFISYAMANIVPKIGDLDRFTFQIYNKNELEDMDKRKQLQDYMNSLLLSKLNES